MFGRIFLSSLLLSHTLASEQEEGTYHTCPKLQPYHEIDAIFLLDQKMVQEFRSKDDAINELIERLIFRENEELMTNLHLTISVKQWYITETDDHQELCSPSHDAVTLKNNQKYYLTQARELAGKHYAFTGFVHKCDFSDTTNNSSSAPGSRFRGSDGSISSNDMATVVNWTYNIGGGDELPEEGGAQARYVYGQSNEKPFGYQYLVRDGGVMLGAWHTERGNDVMAPENRGSTSRVNKVFSQTEIDWICRNGFAASAPEGNESNIRACTKQGAYPMMRNSFTYTKDTAAECGKACAEDLFASDSCKEWTWLGPTSKKWIEMKSTGTTDNCYLFKDESPAETLESTADDVYSGAKGCYDSNVPTVANGAPPVANGAPEVADSAVRVIPCECMLGEADTDPTRECTTETPYRCISCGPPYVLNPYNQCSYLDSTEKKCQCGHGEADDSVMCTESKPYRCKSCKIDSRNLYLDANNHCAVKKF